MIIEILKLLGEPAKRGLLVFGGPRIEGYWMAQHANSLMTLCKFDKRQREWRSPTGSTLTMLVVSGESDSVIRVRSQEFHQYWVEDPLYKITGEQMSIIRSRVRLR